MRIGLDKLAAEVMEGLRDFSDEVAEGMKESIKEAADVVKNDIRSNAPKNTGAYAKSWTSKKTAEKEHSITVTVYSKNRYQLTHLLEHGHAKRGGGRVPAQPHIADAEEKGASFLDKEIRRRLEHG